MKPYFETRGRALSEEYYDWWFRYEYEQSRKGFRFFFGVGDGSTKKAFESLAPRKFNIMINYATKARSVPKNTNLLFIDSGGFSFFYRMKEFPIPHEHYLEFVLKKNANFFANRDYPCEPAVREKWGRTVRENQMKTIENQIAIQDLIDDQYPELKKKFVAVLQGWELDDYLWMLDYMKEHGLLTNLIGLGTMCRRGQEVQIRRYILAIRKNLHKKYKLHAFGVKFGVLRYPDVREALWSADSLAYRYGIDKVKNSKPIWIQIRQKILQWLVLLDSFSDSKQRRLERWLR